MDAYLTILNIIDRLIEEEKVKDMSPAANKAFRHNYIIKKQRVEVLLHTIC